MIGSGCRLRLRILQMTSGWCLRLLLLLSREKNALHMQGGFIGKCLRFTASAWRYLPSRRRELVAGPQPVAECEWAAAAKAWQS